MTPAIDEMPARIRGCIQPGVPDPRLAFESRSGLITQTHTVQFGQDRIGPDTLQEVHIWPKGDPDVLFHYRDEGGDGWSVEDREMLPVEVFPLTVEDHGDVIEFLDFYRRA